MAHENTLFLDRRPRLTPEMARVERDGARLCVAATGRALTEAEARAVSAAGLTDGERLLACVERDGTATRSHHFTFVVWPRTATHSGRLLQELRHAA